MQALWHPDSVCAFIDMKIRCCIWGKEDQTDVGTLSLARIFLALKPMGHLCSEHAPQQCGYAIEAGGESPT